MSHQPRQEEAEMPQQGALTGMAGRQASLLAEKWPLAKKESAEISPWQTDGAAAPPARVCRVLFPSETSRQKYGCLCAQRRVRVLNP